MASSSEARFRLNRLRWRLRGAWTWPAFAAVTVADALIMHMLPPTGTGIRLIPALILAAGANVFLIGAVAPFLERGLARRADRARAGGNPVDGPPPEVLLDRVATAVLLAGMVGLVAAGLAARPLIVSETRATEANARAVREYVRAHGSAEYRRNLDSANTIRLSDGYFRTCVSADDRGRALCMFVEVDGERTSVRRDQSTEPNEEWLGRGGTP